MELEDQVLCDRLIELYTTQVKEDERIRYRRITEIIKLLGLTKGQFYRKLAEDPEFQATYNQAKKARVDICVDEIINIADGTANAQDNIEISSARLRIDARKWVAEKHSNEYSAKVTVDTNPNMSQLSSEEIEARIAALRRRTSFENENPLN